MRMLKLCCTLLMMLCVIPHKAYAEQVSFKNGENTLSGHYLENLNKGPAKGVLLFVHGDGALPYDAEGYYPLIWDQLRISGYSVFSWDKMGVGDSSGNWLHQSMLDRQQEVLKAVDFVQNGYGFTASQTGLIGFSQAGWVIPKLANESEQVGFIIGVGFATNWIDQGRYYTNVSLSESGASEEQKQTALATYQGEIDFLLSAPTYESYQERVGTNGMPKDRFEFVVKNMLSDTTEDYQQLSKPSLLLWGEDDLNVDANKEFSYWNENIKKDSSHAQANRITAKLIKGANHGLLKSDTFDSQQFGFINWLSMMWLEEEALSPEFLPLVLDWLDQIIVSE